MSNYGQAALTIVGTVVGAYFGYPQLGMVLGSLAGQALFPTQLPGVTGPRISDTRTTTAQLGAPVAQVYGVECVPGVVMWMGEVHEVATTEEVGGKGGPEQNVTTYTYFQSIAIGLCEGPKEGIRRIWENGKLVYDRRPQMEGEDDETYAARLQANVDYDQIMTIYTGSEEQLPDPTIEADQGVDSTPAFRGLMYAVYNERELKQEQGYRHPNFKFEITSEGVDYKVIAISPDDNVNIMITADGATWEGTEGPAGQWQDICFSPELGLWAVVGANSAGVMTSSDGENWTTVRDSVTQSRDWNGVCWADDLGLFVAVAIDTGVTDCVMTSPDGATWTIRNAVAQGWSDVIWVSDLGKLIACSQLGNAMTSEDGITWEAHLFPTGSPGSETAYEMAWTGERVITSSRSEIFSMWQTFDGEDFTVVSQSGASGAPTSIAANGDIWIKTLVTGAPGGGGSIWRRTSGNTWLAVEASGNHWEGVIYSPEMGMFVAIAGPGAGDDLDGHRAAYSADGGTTWTLADTPLSADGQEWTALAAGFATTQGQENDTLEGIVTTLCERSGIPEDSVDASDLASDTVPGYVIARVVNGRAAIDPLRLVGYFDIVESGRELKFVKRGKAAVRTLTTEDLGAHEYGTQQAPAVTTRKMQDVDLPRVVRFHYRAPSRDYEEGEQISPARLNTDAVNDVDIECAMSLDDEQAARAAEVNWADTWAGRWQHQIALDLEHIDLEPSDAILVPVDGRLERVRIVSSDDAFPMLRKFDLVRDDDGSYVSVAIADDPIRPLATIAIYAPTELIFLDLPALREEDNDAGFYLTGRPSTAANWSGVSIFRSDDGISFVNEATIVNEPTTGLLFEALPSDVQTNTWDEENSIEVVLETGATFESKTDDEVLAGANMLAIGAHGRWQLVQFADAEQVSAERWSLTRLLWGRRGTEHQIGTSEAQDLVVLVTGLGVIRSVQTNDKIGTTLSYRGVTIGTTVNSAEIVEFEPTGEALEPFSPVDLAGERNVDGDLTITWTRRDRLSQTLEGGDLPLSETVESYEVDVIESGSPESVLRTLTSFSPTVTYTAAQQEEDFGSPAPEAITIRVYQISAAVDRGAAAEATV